ncbi:hypothetical protein K7H22_17820 [Seohaeicola saemankumensis]|uniref:hypothetical protein n=1 Tax=Seohaeicola saemankumensis TaxID=481181 RepID=UPI001E61311E|nr:hypothetical protein [Seohaeicola saemankumensis]MCD1627862.1 hypothetical protein [Seohaeicola saemankumensis]
MSDPVTNVAIEDVLSSIRRLVSEDGRIRPLAPQSEPVSASDDADGQGDDSVPGKLVLTPALRVADAPQGVGHAEHDDKPASGIAQPDDDLPAMQEQDVPVLEAGSDMTQADWQEEQVAADPTDMLDAVESGSEDISDPDAAPTPEALAWEDHRDAAVEDAPLADDMAAPIGEGEFSDDDPAESDLLEFASEPEAAPQFEQPSETVEPQDDAVAPVSGDTASSGAFVFASTRDSAMPQDAVFAPADPDQHLDEIEDDQPSLFGEDETLLDEETLRELVTEIVRQELQGALGERITRNVRKLVRREIHRALTSQELE